MKPEEFRSTEFVVARKRVGVASVAAVAVKNVRRVVLVI
jgi:hypothetical protein